MTYINSSKTEAAEMAAIMKRKKVLVVDDFLNFRITMRNMLTAMGASQLDEAFNGEDAVRKMASRKYDIIMCDYNLGTGKDGQQVLEEVKHRHLISYMTVFMMVTAENTMDMIMGAAEYEPDDYLMKPFTKQTLEKKILAALEKKETFKEITQAIEEMNYDRALTLCDEAMARNQKHLAELLRMKGDTLLRVGDYDKAGQFFEYVSTKGKLPWAILGMGKCQYMSGSYEKAKLTFEEVIRMNNKIMAAYDWLSKTMDQLGNAQEAQRVLIKATDISPRSINRQKELGALAYRNKDMETAEKSFKTVIKQGKHSCFKNSADYTSLAKVLTDKNANQESLAVLGEAEKEFSHDPEAALQIALTESVVYTKMNRPADAREAVNKVMKLVENSSTAVSSDVEIELAKALLNHGEAEKGKDILRRIIQSNHENEALQGQVKEMFKDLNMEKEGQILVETAVGEVVSLNNEGVKLVQQGDLETAKAYFEKAAGKLPDNKIINANAAYAFMLYMKKHSMKPELLHKTRDYLDNVHRIDPEYKDLPRLLNIYREFTKEPLPWMTSIH